MQHSGTGAHPRNDQPLEDQTTAERLATLEILTAKITKIMLQEREPIDQTVYISSSQPWIVDRRGRKHAFLWIPGTALTLSFEDYGSGVVNAQQWINLGFPVGIRMFAVGQSSPVQVLLRFTDEEIP